MFKKRAFQFTLLLTLTLKIFFKEKTDDIKKTITKKRQKSIIIKMQNSEIVVEKTVKHILTVQIFNSLTD